MTIHKMKATTFEPTTYSEWKEVAEKSLRGMPFDKLITKTVEGIDLQPLYTGEQDGIAETIASIRGEKQQAGWIIAQPQYAKAAKMFVAELKESLERGNEAIVYTGTTQFEWDDQSLATVASLLTSYPIFMTDTIGNDPLLQVFNLVPKEERILVRGAVSLSNGELPDGFSNIRTVCADVREVHYKGADAVTELALAIAEGAELAIDYDTFAEFSERFFVRFAVDTHFFMEIAKTRAFRVLWKALGTSFGESVTAHVPIMSDTSLRSYSKLDPYVNLLRAGNEAFSAVLGGADVITVHPHDVLTGINPASIRYARNVQLVIKEETLVNKVIDPAGGSSFVETLTKELVEKAWKLFVEIDSAGGYKAYIASDEFGKRLEERRIIHAEGASKGTKSLVGTNVYADLSASALEGEGGIEVEGRFAEPFEKLRAHFTKQQPSTVLVTFGELREFKPRVDFVNGFLATGGIHSEISPAFTSAAEAIEWLEKERPDYVIICATNPMIEANIEELLAGLPEGITLDIAGKYETALSDKWLGAGLNGFIFNGQDKIAKLKEIKNNGKGDGPE